MSYIGNTPVNQNFVAGADQFSGTGSQTVFTLSRNVNTVFDMFVTVSNVPQDPFTAYTVSGNTLTFDSAPPSGTNNIDVVYRATNVQTFVPTPGVSAQFGLGSAAAPSMTFIGDTNTGIYSPGADTLAFVEGGTEAMRINSSANVGIRTTSPDAILTVQSGGDAQVTLKDSGGTTRAYIGTAGAIGTAPTGALRIRSEQGGIVFGYQGTEQARIDTSGNVQLSTAGTKVLNSSGRPILQQTGGVLQVIQTTKTDTFSTFTTGSWVNITGLSAAITPTSTSSKVLVMVQLSIGGGGNNYGRGYGVKRNSIQLNLGTYGTGSPGSFSASTNFSGGDDGGIMNATFIFLDSPASTSSTTYQVESYADSRSVTGTFINRTKNGTDVGSYGSSTITLMEIAG